MEITHLRQSVLETTTIGHYLFGCLCHGNAHMRMHVSDDSKSLKHSICWAHDQTTLVYVAGRVHAMINSIQCMHVSWEEGRGGDHSALGALSARILSSYLTDTFQVCMQLYHRKYHTYVSTVGKELHTYKVENIHTQVRTYVCTYVHHMFVQNMCMYIHTQVCMYLQKMRQCRTCCTSKNIRS